MSEEDVVDPLDILRERCAATVDCKELKEVMDECTKRVNRRPKTTETCVMELMDFFECLDHCVGRHNLFSHLK